ncbi:MAG: hypothetical protein DHS20C15_04860 [Planctomycetota bacterium]|nr:MAG: hypothetical protein DHS20C15_04860 [Planctomycetota bacterium]
MIRKIPDSPAKSRRKTKASADGSELEREPSAEPAEASARAEPEPEPEAEAAHAEASSEADAEAIDPAEADADLGASEVSDTDDSESAPVNRLPCERPLTQRIEALLFAAGSSMAPAKLARALSEDLDEVKAALTELVETWAAREGAIDLVEISGGWRFMTRPSFADDLAGLAKKSKVEKLSPAALETLAIVAYRQPLGRADVEAIRGVQAGPLLRVLLDRDLIRIAGRSPEPGHPLLYGTTKRFLDHFGLPSLKALPDIKDLLDVT